MLTRSTLNVHCNCQFVVTIHGVISHFGFEGMVFVLIVSVPGHCLYKFFLHISLVLLVEMQITHLICVLVVQLGKGN